MIYLGIDLGGTKIAAALFSSKGEILNESLVLINNRTGEDVCDLIISLCNKLIPNDYDSKKKGLRIGISVPGIAYSKSGKVWAPNIPGWDEFPLKERLLAKFPSANITIESDRTSYILGEALRGAAKGCENAIFIAVGTGIGAGILIDGRILHGASDIVGATGWMALKPPYTNEYDACGCFETYASGNGIAKTAIKYICQTPDYKGLLANLSVEKISAKDVFEAYENGDSLASRVIDEAVELWGMAAANFVSLFNPEILIFGGGVFGPAGALIDKIYDEALKWAQPLSIRQCKFSLSKLGSKAGLYGAGAIAINNY